MRSWTARQWLIAATAAAVIAVATGLITALLPNPIFGRMIEAPWWSYPVWITSALLSGALLATYITGTPRADADGARDQRRGITGAVLSFLAVGCPTCNKLVVLALGTSGAVSWFGPLQPVLAIGSLALLAIALRARLRAVSSCPMPEAAQRT